MIPKIVKDNENLQIVLSLIGSLFYTEDKYVLKKLDEAIPNLPQLFIQNVSKYWWIICQRKFKHKTSMICAANRNALSIDRARVVQMMQNVAANITAREKYWDVVIV